MSGRRSEAYVNQRFRKIYASRDIEESGESRILCAKGNGTVLYCEGTLDRINKISED